MIVGISGKKGSGKDTVGKLFQYFTLPPEMRTVSIEEWVHEISYHPEIERLSTYLENRKYADKLKECTSLLLNIPRWNLELEDVKGQVLPECWNRWLLTSEFETTIHSTKEEAQGVVKFLKLNPSEYTLENQAITVRQFLQWMGTDAMRDIIHPDVWVNSMYTDYDVIGHTNVAALTKDNKHYIKTPTYPSWIVTDVRFPNEVKAISNGLKGKEVDEKYDFRFNIRVERPEYLEDQMKDAHPSETALDNYHEWDYVIQNDCDLDELAFRVHSILKSDPKFKKFFYI